MFNYFALHLTFETDECTSLLCPTLYQRDSVNTTDDKQFIQELNMR